MLRKLGILLVVLLLVAAVGDTVAWYLVVRQMRTGLDTWMNARRAAGWSVAASAPEAGGWPVAATLTLHDVALRAGNTVVPGGMAWSAEQVVLRLAARQPHELRIDAAGTQRLRVSDGPDLVYTAGRLRLLAPLQAAPPAQPLSLQGEDLRIGLAPAATATAAESGNDHDGAVPAAGGSGSGDTLTIQRLTADAVLNGAAGRGQAAVTLAASANGITLPATMRWALGASVGSFNLDAALNGPLPAGNGLAASASAWRDAGGSIAVRQLATQWGPLGLAATGTLTLDKQLQPAGSGEAQVTGYGATLEALARQGVMSRSAALTATAVLSLMADTPSGGGSPAVDVPLSLRGGLLSMQHVPLLRVPALDWPSP